MLLSLFAPYTAEECWELLGHKPSVAEAAWPAADPALLTQDKVTCVVQVNGKVRDRLEVSPADRRGRTARARAGRARGGPHAGRASRCAGSSCGRPSWSASSPRNACAPRFPDRAGDGAGADASGLFW